MQVSKQGSPNIRVEGPRVLIRANTGEWFYFDVRDQPLGSGAMGTVYPGRALANHRQLVAIKKVSSEIENNQKIRKRAREEAALAFRHQNMVEMIGYCENHPCCGPMFIISKLVQGITIDRYVRMNFENKPDRTVRIVRCILPVLDALEYLHNKSILHMDIKPSNIMIENSSNVRLMDLGIACTSSVIDPTKGGLIGTPGYAAPEQYVEAGQTELDISKATDIYELGATIYDLLSGRKPYSDNPNRLTIIQKIPNKLMKVLSKALAKRQEDRYQTAREFKAALKDALLPRQNPVWPKVIAIAVGVAAIAVLIYVKMYT